MRSQVTRKLRRVVDRLCLLQGLTCREATRLAAHVMDRSLTCRERVGLFLHCVLCSYCRNYVRHLRLLRKWMRRLDGLNASSPGHRMRAVSACRIKKRLESEISRVE
jgi:hypothetical protein